MAASPTAATASTRRPNIPEYTCTRERDQILTLARRPLEATWLHEPLGDRGIMQHSPQSTCVHSLPVIQEFPHAHVSKGMAGQLGEYGGGNGRHVRSQPGRLQHM